MTGKKKRKTVSRRKKFRRDQRLQSAREWLAAYEGDNPTLAYRRRYGIDWPTAFIELELLGVAIDPDYKKQVLQSVEGELAARRRKKAGREAELGIDQDDCFGYIVGYTSGGAPYGLTWEEWDAIEREAELEWQFEEDPADEEGSGT